MEQRKTTKWRLPAQTGQTEQLLADYYSQLLKWGLVLTRGDEGKAQDIVQEFCLYFTLTKPDLSEIASLDGYLYTCLRHIYLSGLTRSAREALHFVSVAEFDSFEFAVAADQSVDPLQRQNDLRRICFYTVWRKESSKSASYFILHFFHGYSRREIAELARLPISAIYNKLKAARSEVKSYLEESSKLRVVSRDQPTEPALSWSLLPYAEFFKELRETILKARTSDCISEEDLLSYYRAVESGPIACSLLAHIVSCERCLAIIDRFFRRPTLQDREPLDSSGSSSEMSDGSLFVSSDLKQKTMLQSVHKRWRTVYEHRPEALSIAVNGKIIAFHDIQGEHCMLSARIEHPEDAQFVEIFSEQGVRFALLSIGDLPPEGAPVRAVHIGLSDARWLELTLSFDGLGLSSQVAYCDPALAIEALEKAEDLPSPWTVSVHDPIQLPQAYSPQPLWVSAAFRRFLSAMTSASAVSWALALAIVFCTAVYVAYHHANPPINANEILNRSMEIETADLQGQTEHQVLRFEEVSANGEVVQQGTVDLWKDGDDRRYLRRLYDFRHHLVAAEWQNKNGEHRSHGSQGDKKTSDAHRRQSMTELWDQDLSTQAFTKLGGEGPQIQVVKGSYELTTVGPVEGRPQLVSATIILDSHLRPVREIMRVRTGSEIHELRFAQADYERRPSSSVPDETFDPGYVGVRPSQGLHSSLPPQGIPNAIGTDAQLAQLQIAVLYQLNSLNADTGEPIEVSRTSDGHIQVSGTVVDGALRQKIADHLKKLGDHSLLELRLISPESAQAGVSASSQPIPADTNIYDVNQTTPVIDATLLRYLQKQGVTDAQLDSAAGKFSRDVLQRAQRALQEAYALNRLGTALSPVELKSISLSSREQWTEMVNKHAANLESQFRALQGKLAELSPLGGPVTDINGEYVGIQEPAQFRGTTYSILHQTQDLNRDIGRLFASNLLGKTQTDPNVLWRAIMTDIPLRQSEEITRFAVQLKTSEGSILASQEHTKDGKDLLERQR